MKKQSKISELRWPIGIVLAILAVVALGIWTIEQANIKPVSLDDYYFANKRYVSEHINEIRQKQAAFDQKYTITLSKNALRVGENDLSLTVTTKADNTPVADANVTVKITRPDTNAYDQFLKVADYENGTYRFDNFELKQIGRWQIKAKITTPDDLTSFSVTEVNATK